MGGSGIGKLITLRTPSVQFFFFFLLSYIHILSKEGAKRCINEMDFGGSNKGGPAGCTHPSSSRCIFKKRKRKVTLFSVSHAPERNCVSKLCKISVSTQQSKSHTSIFVLPTFSWPEKTDACNHDCPQRDKSRQTDISTIPFSKLCVRFPKIRIYYLKKKIIIGLLDSFMI